MIGIYKITNKINGKIYIGQSIDIFKRWEYHIYWNNDDTHFHRALKKYGVKNFNFEIIEECSKEQLNEREQFWIKYYNTYENGYNMTIGGESTHLSVNIDKDEVVKMYNETGSIYKTAELFHVHRHTVSKILDSKGIVKKDVSAKRVFMINTETLEVEKEFKTIVDASHYIGLSDSAIRKALKSTDRTSGGYYWSLADNFDKNLFSSKPMKKRKKK